MASEDIDDALYSRQRYVLGDGAMRSLARSNVFLSGMAGLGAEVAKNIALAGVARLTLHDTEESTAEDLGTQFFLEELDIEKRQNRALASVRKIATLNPHVSVTTSTLDLTDPDLDLSFLNTFQVVIMTAGQLSVCVRINDYCRGHSISFVYAAAVGACSSLFCDFGDNFEVQDATGEPERSVILSSVQVSDSGIGTCDTLEGHMHGFEDLDTVEFNEVIHRETAADFPKSSMNGKQFTVKVLSPYQFAVTDMFGVKPYLRGGIARQLKTAKKVTFQSLRHQLLHPEMLISDFSKSDAPLKLHICMLALDKFRIARGDQLPQAWCVEDADYFASLCEQVKTEMAEAGNVEARSLSLPISLVKKFSFTARGCLCMMTATVGGIVAQEALKALTGKFMPLHQWVYFDAFEVVPDTVAQATKATIDSSSSLSSIRMNALRICVGNQIVNRLEKLRVFMIGAGAIGCEMLKNLALMGVACGSETEGPSSPGKRKREETTGPLSGVSSCRLNELADEASEKPCLFLTDNDVIEHSNLNRQFLFRPDDIRKPKSVVAAHAAQSIQPSMCIEAQQHRVGPESESVYSDDFLQSIDVVVNALDNVTARRYVDSRCVATRRPMLDSGTLGTKGHVQVVLPFVSESYCSQADPVENEVPYCTLRSFPSTIEHCIEWARDRFETIFVGKSRGLMTFLEDHSSDLVSYILEASDSELNEGRASWRALKRCMEMHSFADCIRRARLKFQKMFCNDILQLLYAFPVDMVLQDGTPYWTLPKRPPHPLDFDEDDPVHFAFIVHMASLYAALYRIAIPNDWEVSPRSIASEALKDLEIPVFSPDPNKRIIDDESVGKGQTVVEDEGETPVSVSKGNVDRQHFVQLCRQYVDWKSSSNARAELKVDDFEKDDDSNHHVDFVTVSANLRARNYNIEEVDRLKVKLIAGKIVPAIATTTSAVSGLVALELLKIVWKDVQQDVADVHLAKNSFLNLALPFFALSDPAPAPRTRITKELSFTLWDRWDVRSLLQVSLGPKATLQNFVDHISTTYNLGVASVFVGARTVYVPLFPGHAKRLKKKMKSLLVKKDQPPPAPKYMDLTVTFEDMSTGEDVDGPVVRYFFSGS